MFVDDQPPIGVVAVVDGVVVDVVAVDVVAVDGVAVDVVAVDGVVDVLWGGQEGGGVGGLVQRVFYQPWSMR